MREKECVECGCTEHLKRGWTNCLYCSEECERKGVSRLHNSMPGGPNPYPGWIPYHTAKEIRLRWEDEI